MPLLGIPSDTRSSAETPGVHFYPGFRTLFTFVFTTRLSWLSHACTAVAIHDDGAHASDDQQRNATGAALFVLNHRPHESSVAQWPAQ
jgi:hypothetical protein